MAQETAVVQTFEYVMKTAQLRTVEIDGQIYFVGKDVANILGYINPRDALAKHVDEEDKRIIQKSQIATLEIPNRGMTVINEPGLYSLIINSKIPQAKKFKHWVFHEVLPSIRKTGSYSLTKPVEPEIVENEPQKSEDELIESAWAWLERVIDSNMLSATEQAVLFRLAIESVKKRDQKEITAYVLAKRIASDVRTIARAIKNLQENKILPKTLADIAF